MTFRNCFFNNFMKNRFKTIWPKKRNVRLKIVASGCDQCVWPVGMAAGYGHWVGALNDVISGQCVFKA